MQKPASQAFAYASLSITADANSEVFASCRVFHLTGEIIGHNPVGDGSGIGRFDGVGGLFQPM